MSTEFSNIELTRIAPSLTNPRKNFNPTKLAELAEDIKRRGIDTPITVRPLPGGRVADTERAVQFELVCGERRLRASALAGVATIPAMVRALTDDQALEIQLCENLKRDDLTALEEAEGYETLMQHANINADQVGERIGKSRSWVYSRLKLLELTVEGKQALGEEKIDASRALLIARIPDGKLQLKALEYATNPDWQNERPSVRSFQKWLKVNVMLELDEAIFKITDARLIEAAGSCNDCPKRTGANPDLFADVESTDICTDPVCFHGKEEAHRNQLRKRAESKGLRVVEGKEAMEMLAGHQGQRVPTGYEDLSLKRPDLGQQGDTVKTLGEFLGKDVPDAILFVHPRTQQMTEMVPTEKAQLALLAKGITAQLDEDEDDDEQDYQAHLESLQKRATERTEQLVHKGLFAESVKGVRALDDKAAAKLLCMGDLLRGILLTKLSEYAVDEEQMAAALGYTFADGEDEQDGLAMHIRATTTANLCKALVICELHNDLHFSSHTTPLVLPVLVNELAVDTKAVTKDAKATAKAEFAERINAAKAKIDAKNAEKAPPATASAARPQEGAGGAKGKVPASKKPPARVAKLSAEEATQGIAAAMQGLGGPASADAVAPSAQPAGMAGFAVGQAVRITTSTDKLRLKHDKYAGKAGTITGFDIGGKELDVKVGRDTRCFEPGELELVEVAAA